MRTTKIIRRYDLEVTDNALDVPMPEGSELLSVGDFGGILVLWALSDTKAKGVVRRLRIVDTNIAVMTYDGLGEFVGTAASKGWIVHVFDMGEGD